MTKYRPPAPANDHLAAFRTEDDLDRLTDAEIEARLEASGKALGRELKLRTLRIHERILSRASAKPSKDHH